MAFASDLAVELTRFCSPNRPRSKFTIVVNESVRHDDKIQKK